MVNLFVVGAVQNIWFIFLFTQIVATHTHNRFTARLEYVRVHPGEQVSER